jgi:hypothetical protein
MNKLDFDIEKSKTQYDIYKYKLGKVISYSKRKIYRYSVKGIVYNLRTEPRFKYLFKLGVSLEDWDKFKNELWEHKLYELDLYSNITNHLSGMSSFNKFNSIRLPEDLDLDLQEHECSEIELIVDWFRDENFKPNNNQVYLVIFHR